MNHGLPNSPFAKEAELGSLSILQLGTSLRDILGKEWFLKVKILSDASTSKPNSPPTNLEVPIQIIPHRKSFA